MAWSDLWPGTFWLRMNRSPWWAEETSCHKIKDLWNNPREKAQRSSFCHLLTWGLFISSWGEGSEEEEGKVGADRLVGWARKVWRAADTHSARFDSKYSMHLGYLSLASSGGSAMFSPFLFTVVEVSTPSRLVASAFSFHQTWHMETVWLIPCCGSWLDASLSWTYIKAKSCCTASSRLSTSWHEWALLVIGQPWSTTVCLTNPVQRTGINGKFIWWRRIRSALLSGVQKLARKWINNTKSPKLHKIL